MHTCKDCLSFEVCKLKDLNVSLGTKVEETVSDGFKCFKNADRFLNVPCKLDETVYILDYTAKGPQLFECKVEEICFFTYGTYIYFNWGKNSPRFKACSPDRFGKIAFTDKEEAKRALQAARGGLKK